MARKAAFTVPSLEEMEQTDQQKPLQPLGGGNNQQGSSTYTLNNKDTSDGRESSLVPLQPLGGGNNQQGSSTYTLNNKDTSDGRESSLVISTYATVKDGISKSLSAISANAHTESTTTASVARSTSNLQATKECNTNPSRTTKLPTVPSVEYVVPKSAGIIGDNRKPVGVKTVPIISLGNHQSTLPASASNTPSGNSQPVVAVTTSGKTNAIIVSARQKGNPVLKCIRNVPWEFGDIVPDYQLGQTSCALFLSTRYHLLYPAYIHERLKQLGHSFHLRALLMLIDVKDPHHALKEVAKMCILADCSLILAFTVEEAGRYLETFKSFEKKPPDLIMEKTEGNFLSQVTDVFTSARKINKTDAMTLLSTFGTVKGVVESSQDELSLCPGFGPQKAQRLHRLVHEPFIKVKKTKGSQLTDEAAVQPSSSAGATGGVDDTRTKTNRENVTALEKV